MDVFDLVGRILAGVMIGGLCGSMPLIVGIYLKRIWLGCIGMAVSMGFGLLMTLVLYRPAFLSFFPSAAMSGLIYLLSRKQNKH
ncbi:MAG: hypothetical protein J6D16_02035 [Clostridia bacterium]|nr:hypothetical protein [Clostridia bacterium]